MYDLVVDAFIKVGGGQFANFYNILDTGLNIEACIKVAKHLATVMPYQNGIAYEYTCSIML